MRLEQLLRIGSHGVCLDTETHCIQPGLLAPPLVCGSIAQHDGERFHGELLNKDQTLEAFRLLIEDPTRIITGANIAFDLLVCAVEWARRGVDMMPAIFQAYEDERVYDILIGEALHAIAEGHLGKDPRTGGDLRDPETGKTSNRYSLAISCDLTLDRKNAKVNDEWRTKYADLEFIPIDQWPENAKTYPVDDVRNTHEAAMAQVGLLPKRSSHRWRSGDGLGEPDTVCDACGIALTAGGPKVDCKAIAMHRNLHAMATQAYTAWAMHLGAAWGFNVDQSAVDVVEKTVLEKRAAISVPLIAANLLKWKKEKGVVKLGKDTATIARAVATAFGASGRCDECVGTAKVRSPKAPLVRCKPCRGGGWIGARAVDNHNGTVTPAINTTCTDCAGVGKVPSEKHRINCQACRATGLDLTTAPTLSCTPPSSKFPNGQVQAGRDILYESGDDILYELAEYGVDAKTLSNYVPYLRKARIQCVAADGTVYYRSRPLTLKPNVLLETDRVSYGDPVQQFPRSGGLRACIAARAGFVFCSTDYNFGELIAHAQSCLWLVGVSDLAVSLLKGVDPHAALAADVLQETYEFFVGEQKVKKTKRRTNMRQAAKPIVFGKPAAMGAPKIVLTQRKNGPDTECLNGPVIIDHKKGTRGYKGLRFCIVMDSATSCGDIKVTEWGRPGHEKPISPSCRHCLECVERISDNWLKLYKENRPYSRLVSDSTKNGQIIWDGSRLAPGEVRQHVSGIIRGAVTYTEGCNGWFQSLLAVASKLALRRAQRECCDPSFIVPTDAFTYTNAAGETYTGKPSAYAGQRSPLYGSRVIVLQHDELFAELRRALMHEGGTRLSEIMVRALQETCPDLAGACKAPPALQENWQKAAEPVYIAPDGTPCKETDDGARLTVWFEEKIAA